jgi:regulator of sigma E protease
VLVLLSVLGFFLLLTGLVLIHEWGHYIVARLSGITVEEFGFGLPPRALTLFKRKGTTFSLNWIPFGGFVRLKGESDEPGQRRAPGNFASASLFARCCVLLAGVGMNFLLALALFTVGFSIGRWVPTYLTIEEWQMAGERGELTVDIGVLIQRVTPEGAAAAVGVPTPSILRSVDGREVRRSEQVREFQQGKEIVRYELLTGTGFTVARTIDVRPIDGLSGVVLQVLPRILDVPRRGVLEGFTLAVREVGVVTVQTLYGLGALVTSLASKAAVPEGITGIVGIAQLTYASVQQGFGVYVRLVALLSLSLAILNVLPFPALDGGRLALVLLEAGLSSRLVQRVKPLRSVLQSFFVFERYANAIGFLLLLGVIVLVTVYDVIRIFR